MIPVLLVYELSLECDKEEAARRAAYDKGYSDGDAGYAYARGYNVGHDAGWKVGYRACQLHAMQLINNMRGGD